jgi:hypothetical protein
VIVRREAGPDAWWPKDAQVRVGKQQLAAKGPNQNRQSDSLNKCLLTLSHGKMKKGDVEFDGVNEFELIRLPQVYVAAIQGTEELWQWTRFK